MGKQIRSITLLCFLLTVFLTGCNTAMPGPTEPPVVTEPTQQLEPALPSDGTWDCLLPEYAPSADSAADPAVPSAGSTAEKWVIPAISKTYEWDDGVGNRNRVTIRLPHIDANKDYAVAFNADIDAFAHSIITEVEECAEGAFSTHIVSVDYEAWLNVDTLSILITTKTDTDNTEYRVANFDLDDGEAMTVADMCDEYPDIPYPVFLKYTRDQILRDFETEYADFIAQFPADYEFIRQLYLSDLYIVRGYQLYLAEGGTLMLVCDRPSIAGAASYAELQELSIDPANVPNEAQSWQWFFDLYLGADQNNVEFARDILIIAYEEDEDDFMDALKQRPGNEQEAIETAVRVKYHTKG